VVAIAVREAELVKIKDRKRGGERRRRKNKHVCERLSMHFSLLFLIRDGWRVLAAAAAAAAGAFVVMLPYISF